MFLDRRPDRKRVQLATFLNIAVVVAENSEFVLLNPESAAESLSKIFPAESTDEPSNVAKVEIDRTPDRGQPTGKC
jgi:hypothetical protein